MYRVRWSRPSTDPSSSSSFSSSSSLNGAASGSRPVAQVVADTMEGGAISGFAFNPRHSDWLATGYAGNASVQVWELGADLSKPAGDELEQLIALLAGSGEAS